MCVFCGVYFVSLLFSTSLCTTRLVFFPFSNVCLSGLAFTVSYSLRGQHAPPRVRTARVRRFEKKEKRERNLGKSVTSHTQYDGALRSLVSHTAFASSFFILCVERCARRPNEGRGVSSFVSSISYSPSLAWWCPGLHRVVLKDTENIYIYISRRGLPFLFFFFALSIFVRCAGKKDRNCSSQRGSTRMERERHSPFRYLSCF
jgi:hypothetical protein